MPDAVRILVSGMVAGVPHHGGATWAVLQYVLGLRHLGHDVLLVGRDGLVPAGAGLVDSDNARYFRSVVEEFGLERSAALLVAGTRATVGLSYDELRRRARGADVLVNVAGMLAEPKLVEPISVRIYLDLDPAFTQLWHEQGVDVGLAGHTHFATVGRAIGSEVCDVPTCGVEWIGIDPPVVLDHWAGNSALEYEGLTTVANWRSYGSLEHAGVFYGQKAHSFRGLIALPTMTETALFLALAIHPDEEKDLEALRRNGWRLLDPLEVAGTPGRYRRFVQASRAELGVAKSGYVFSKCGWFSDRSVCYLASGRPVVAQDAGFAEFYPVGEGLLSFATLDEAVDAAEELQTNYERHSRAARELAREYFDSDRVLTRLLERAGAA